MTASRPGDTVARRRLLTLLAGTAALSPLTGNALVRAEEPEALYAALLRRPDATLATGAGA
jgi:hypothetical protein